MGDIAIDHNPQPRLETASIKMKSIHRVISSVVLYSGSRRSRILYAGNTLTYYKRSSS